MANDLSTVLSTELEEQRAALPVGFNIQRFVQNGIALLQGNDTLQEYAGKYGGEGVLQIKQGMVRGAYLGLDFLNGEAYLVPYGKQLNFMASYKGLVKLATKYSTRPIKTIYAKCVREGDDFQEIIDHGEPSINFKALPFNDGNIIGVFAVCQYQDGGIVYEVMSRDEVEKCRKSSKAKNSPAWNQFWSEMAKKTVLRRLCKSLSIDMDAKAVEAMDSGLEIETDVKEQVANEIEAEANQVEFYADWDNADDVIE